MDVVDDNINKLPQNEQNLDKKVEIDNLKDYQSILSIENKENAIKIDSDYEIENDPKQGV